MVRLKETNNTIKQLYKQENTTFNQSQNLKITNQT